MRFVAVAAFVFSGLFFLVTTTASARGPGDANHAGGNHPNLAGGSSAGSGFKPGRFEGGPGSGDKLKALQNTDSNGNSDQPNLAELHPHTAGALRFAAGNSGAGTNNLNHATNGFMPLNNNFAGQGGGLAHHAGELLGFLEMAKNSSDPQVAARATQILQQFKQHLAQERANWGQGGSTNTSATSGNVGSTSGFLPNQANANHGESAHAGNHAGGHSTH
jgi:hypothetical protein